MADKKQINRNLKKLERIQTWQLIVVFIITCFISATFLRINNVGMVERRAAVVTADERGDDVKTRARLNELQRFVTAHMNTYMGKGVYLEASYKRDVQAAYDKAAAGVNPNGNIYKKAQEVCMPRYSSWSYAYVQCTVNELAKYPEGNDMANIVEEPSPDLYLHVFASPAWSPDFAGWSMLICVVILIMIIIRFIGVVILKIMLHSRKKNI